MFSLTFFVIIYAVSEETCNEVESLVFDLFANLGATGAEIFNQIHLLLF